MGIPEPVGGEVGGAFVTVDGERHYAIFNVDKLPPFFISVVSSSDHWLFVASNGGLTAGRVSPDTALFPYVTVDKLYDSTPHTGSRTLLRANRGEESREWEPFNREQDGRYAITRNLYKSILGHTLLFEEINHDLGLAFRYRWAFSDAYGFVRQAELSNLSTTGCAVELLDGLQNLLPAGTPPTVQANTSYLVDAYKWNELDEATGLAFFTLYSGISDRAEPCESLRATTVFCLGLEGHRVLLSSRQIEDFRRCEAVAGETCQRGVRGAYLVSASLELPANSARRWKLVANVERTQSDAVDLLRQLRDPATLDASIGRSLARSADALARIVAAGDGLQGTAEENVAAHHQANVLFNVLRGGIVSDRYLIPSSNFVRHVQFFNRRVHDRHRLLLGSLPEKVPYDLLRSTIEQTGDAQLMRVAREFLPITFGRRHGDPSRPWNRFVIKLTDDEGNVPLTYQGNWRDIFQNWEALLLGYPELIEDVIAKFVNASTVDGYNPYRISDEGIDWEVEDPDDPWSYIGYWGDHQIIYLLKLLELSRQFHPARLSELLQKPLFSYANVPYRIRPFEDLVKDAKRTVDYDEELAERINRRVAELGADGKLLLDGEGHVYQVTLLEKLLVPLLGKLANLVVDGGIWLNTQRPEWNDANNALVGQGLSVVTLCHLRRYVRFLRELFAHQPTAQLSREVQQWLVASAGALRGVREHLGDSPIDEARRYQVLRQLGLAASRYRQALYEQESFTGTVAQSLEPIDDMLADTLAVIDHGIHGNRRPDGLFNAYNMLDLQPGAAAVEPLQPMLEGQVAALSSGAISPEEAVELLEALFRSDLYRADQKSFLLYPDRELPLFLEKNRIPAADVAAIPLLERMLAAGDSRIVERDVAGTFRFDADLINAGALTERLDSLSPVYGELLEAGRQPVQALYGTVFNHRAFTGRSGGMFGFEGLGSIYWHMVSKLLLAIQEIFVAAPECGTDENTRKRLGVLYYRVRDGLGFNKTPAEHGAFPTDPYSHTPAHAGAQQPGMTGSVKEEILTRLVELGVLVRAGSVLFDPSLLRAREFRRAPEPFRFLDVEGQWQDLDVAGPGLAFTWCQVPICYRLDDSVRPTLTIVRDNGMRTAMPSLLLPSQEAREIFQRSGRIRLIELLLNSDQLLSP